MSRIRPFLLLAALALFPAAAQAQTTITACYVPKSGSVYRIKVEGAPGKCAQNHVEFSWDTGITITPIMWGDYTTITDTFTMQPGEWNFGVALCPIGHAAMTGGFVVHDPETANVLITSSQHNGITPAWGVGARNLGSDPAQVTVKVYCADFVP
jgi:hypothetical protein